jgi:hypothetical protein
LDRRGRKALLAAFALACASLAAAQAQAPLFPLRAAKWLTAKDPVAALTTQPSECLARPADAETAWSVEVGRAVFRSPVLLGGQAAKAGLSCETCHRAGRGNVEFHFPGVSGEPGTADVTSSLFSSHRGDGTDNPKPIPDLGGPPAKLKVSRAADTPELADFLRGLVVEEFDGPEPAPAVLKGLADYVRQVRAQACPAATAEPLTPGAAADDVARAVRAAQGALARHDEPTAQTVLESARAMLFLIDERYALPELEAERNLVRTASLDLGSAQSALRRGDSAGPILDLWLSRYPAWRARLVRAQSRSLYDPGVLGRSLQGAASTPTVARAASSDAVSPRTGCTQSGAISASGPITNSRSAALGCGTTSPSASTAVRP